MTTSSKGPFGLVGHRDAYRDLLESMRRAGADKINGYGDVTWNGAYRAAERLDELRFTSRYSAAVFDRIFALTLERARKANAVKAMLVGRVMFVKSLPTIARNAAKASALTDEQLRDIARRLARR